MKHKHKRVLARIAKLLILQADALTDIEVMRLFDDIIDQLETTIIPDTHESDLAAQLREVANLPDDIGGDED